MRAKYFSQNSASPLKKFLRAPLAVTHTSFKCMKSDVFSYKSDMHMCYRKAYLHRLELLRQAQEKDGNRGIKITGKQPAAIELTRRDHSTALSL